MTEQKSDQETRILELTLPELIPRYEGVKRLWIVGSVLWLVFVAFDAYQARLFHHPCSAWTNTGTGLFPTYEPNDQALINGLILGPGTTYKGSLQSPCQDQLGFGLSITKVASAPVVSWFYMKLGTYLLAALALPILVALAGIGFLMVSRWVGQGFKQDRP